MKEIVKYFVAKTYKPLLVKYLSSTRIYKYQNIKLQIPSEVFHPGYFTSTHLLLNYIRTISLKNRLFLELGGGSGLIAIDAAKKGANVTASDINSTAIDYLYKNASTNQVKINIIHSDLFKSIPHQQFDVIAINPPYYKRSAKNEKEFAWYCGENGEYFEGLFTQLGNYIHPQTLVLMVLCDACDFEMIFDLARQHSFDMQCIVQKKSLIETNFIYKIILNK